MRTPKRKANDWHWIPPDREWLYDQYITQGKAAGRIARDVGVTPPTVFSWLELLEIPRRTYAQAKALLVGRQSPNWRGGSHSYCGSLARKILQEAGISKACVRCGEETGYNEVHHKDGDEGNNLLENLEWLCKGCHSSIHFRERNIAG